MTNRKYSTQDLVQLALIAALYVVLTVTPPINVISFGAVQFRISEMLNFLVFFNRKHLLGVTLGCVVANALQSTWLDVLVGAGSTFIFVGLGVQLFKQYQDRLIFKGYFNLGFLYFALFFSFFMVTIALELVYLYDLPFWWTWLTLALGELASLLSGGVLIQALSKRIDFERLRMK